MGDERDSDPRLERPLSPCILLCTLDDAQRCLGCGRSLAQISAWAMMTVAEQWQVIDELAAREAGNDATIAPECGEQPCD